jgi:hypothetical protein
VLHYARVPARASEAPFSAIAPLPPARPGASGNKEPAARWLIIRKEVPRAPAQITTSARLYRETRPASYRHKYFTKTTGRTGGAALDLEIICAECAVVATCVRERDAERRLRKRECAIVVAHRAGKETRGAARRARLEPRIKTVSLRFQPSRLSRPTCSFIDAIALGN